MNIIISLFAAKNTAGKMLRIRVLSLSNRFTFSRLLSSTQTSHASSACPAEEQQSLGNAARPFSEIPTPGGAIPFLGHLSLLRKFGNGDDMTKVSRELFKEFGPIVRLKTPCKYELRYLA